VGKVTSEERIWQACADDMRECGRELQKCDWHTEKKTMAPTIRCDTALKHHYYINLDIEELLAYVIPFSRAELDFTSCCCRPRIVAGIVVVELRSTNNYRKQE
jgi:hypothetical protein